MTSPRRVHIRPAAAADIAEQAEFFRVSNVEVASRFLLAVVKANKMLAKMPGVGAKHQFANPLLGEVRIWRLSDFPNHLLFYREHLQSIEVLRLLHAARDWQTFLNE